MPVPLRVVRVFRGVIRADIKQAQTYLHRIIGWQNRHPTYQQVFPPEDSVALNTILTDLQNALSATRRR